MLEIVAVPAFSDNYIWLVHDAPSGETAVVDPGDAGPALAAAAERAWTITQVWNTHWHPDHTGGNRAVKDATGCTVLGPAAETIGARDVALAQGDKVRIGDQVGEVIEIPGHTLGHIALHFASAPSGVCLRHIVCMGCARLFGGPPSKLPTSLAAPCRAPARPGLSAAMNTPSPRLFASHASPKCDNRRRLAAVSPAGARRDPPSDTVAPRARDHPFVRSRPHSFCAFAAEKDSFR